MTDFLDELVLSRATLDRAALLRTDAAWMAAALRDPNSTVAWVRGSAVAAYVDPVACALFATPAATVDDRHPVSFLGLDSAGRARFAVHVPADHPGPDGAQWVTLREVGHRLDATDAGIAVTATALDQWRSATRVCAACATGLQATQAGWALHCPSCRSDVFPRTDPAVIVLVRDPDDRALLGRNVAWPQGRMSTFAGFVEAGESAEAAARREVLEETGVVIERLEYLGSQPWPFPRSLMLGYHAWTTSTVTSPDAEEIAEVRWFAREELLAEAAAGRVLLPPSISISRRLIEAWLGGPVEGDWTEPTGRR